MTSDCGSASSAPDSAVAIAVSGSRSRRAVKWASVNLIPYASRVLLLHVAPRVSSIPTPSGQRPPVQRAGSGVVRVNREDAEVQAKQGLAPIEKLCGTNKEVKIVLLDGEDTAAELLRYMSDSGVRNLVLGAPSFTWLTRILKWPDVPTTVLNSAPDTYNIFLVSRRKLVVKLTSCSDSLSASQVRKIKNKILTQRDRSRIFDEHTSMPNSMLPELSNRTLEMSLPSTFGRTVSQSSTGLHSRSSLSSELSDRISGISLPSNFDRTNSHASNGSDVSVATWQTSEISPKVACLLGHQHGENCHYLSNSFQENRRSRRPSLDSVPPVASQKSDEIAEIQNLKIELQNTLSMYNRTCKDLIYARKKVQSLAAEYSEETRKVKSALEREEVLRQIAAEEKAKHLEAVKEVEEARQLLAEAALKRHRAEIKAIKESTEKVKVENALFSGDKRCKRYSSDEIEVATNNFSESNKIGEGGYGNVYRCNLDHMPVAIKVLKRETLEKKEQFLREVEVLTRLNHPNMVLLLGVCPERRCLIYEYMENGSLEDRLFCKDDTQPLPWATRFRVAYEVACVLAFLHSSKPEPIVHCDMKPGNILLDRNFTSKIGDVGLAKLMSNVVPDSITEYRDTVITGTLHYLDPEYHRTGTIRPKSDLYAFGIIMLQLLTGRRPLGLLVAVESAMSDGSLADILDKTVSGWPLIEAERLAQIALQCASLRCRDRPDLESEVIPELEKLFSVFNAQLKLNKTYASVPSHYFCPILQEVMEDPYIAADGFTYEHRAIKAWLAKHSVSPVTKLKLQHRCLIPNHTMRSAIQEWKSRVELSTA